MHRGRNKESATRSSSHATFKKRFGLALLASFGMHAGLFAFLPWTAPLSGTSEAHNAKPLAVKLAWRDDTQSRSPQSPQRYRLGEPAPPPHTPHNPLNEAAPLSEYRQEAHSGDSGAGEPGLAQSAPIYQGNEAALDRHDTATEKLGQASGGLDQPIDAALIGQEFKRAFMSLLSYPEAARRRGVQGTVGLRIIMDSEGRIIEAMVSQTSGSSILDRAALSAAQSTPGPSAGPGRRLELSLRVSFEAGRILARP